MTIRDETVVTRKPHPCLMCLRIIPRGSEMRYWVGTYEGDFQAHYTCKTCDQLADIGKEGFINDEGFEQGCVADSLEKGQTPEDLLEEIRKMKGINVTT